MLIRPPYPLSAYASGNPFTPSSLPFHFETPIPPHSISTPPSLVETPIPTITTTPPVPPPTNSNDPDLDDIPLSQLHPKIPRRPHKHISIKRTHICISFPHSASQAQLQEATESSKKRKRIGKSPPRQGVFPRGERRHEASFKDMGIAHALENKDPINWPSLMIKHMATVIDPKPGAHQLAFGNLLTTMFKDFDVPLGEGRALVSCDMITRSTIAIWRLYDEGNHAPSFPPRVPSPVATLLNDLHAVREQNETSVPNLKLLAMSSYVSGGSCSIKESAGAATKYIPTNRRMTNQEADHSMKEAFAAMGGMSGDESEDEETENQSLLAIEQTDKYHFLALVDITEPEDKENNCQIQETIQALMVGLDSKEEEEEEDKKDQISPPPSPVKTSIPTITTTPPLPLPINPNDLDLEAIPLSQLHPKIPWRPRKHISIKITHITVQLARSASQAQLQEAAESIHKLLFKLVHKGVLPRGGRRHEASLRDMGIAHALENKDPIDCPSLMIKHMARITDPKPCAHQLAFGNLITTMFTTFDVPLGEGRALVSCDMITRSTLATCRLYDESNQAPAALPRVPGPIATLLNDLHAAKEQNETLYAELEAFRNALAMSQGKVA
ncbi:hypothetical protein H5410_052415 [Solanum commersonii]|uniref:Uncharacterized protein n=1 Tax=Solanum commersonii TaxID=4109 RepID=A0A9J5X3C1_SOLCO|nr:hypothetical protein H5410_052415 [Solanum commersonii]